MCVWLCVCVCVCVWHDPQPHPCGAEHSVCSFLTSWDKAAVVALGWGRLWTLNHPGLSKEVGHLLCPSPEAARCHSPTGDLCLPLNFLHNDFTGLGRQKRSWRSVNGPDRPPGPLLLTAARILCISALPLFAAALVMLQASPGAGGPCQGHTLSPTALQDLKAGAALRHTAVAQGLPILRQDGTDSCLPFRPFALIKIQDSAEHLAHGGLLSLVSVASCRS